MALTGRAVVLAAAGVLVVLVVPVPGTVLVWAAVCALLVGLDIGLAASPRAVAVSRDLPASVRLGTPTRSVLTLTALGPRRLRAVVRDAWPPSAIPDPLAAVRTAPRLSVRSPRHRVEIAPGDGARVSTDLVPTRRGDLVAGGVTLRTVGPLGLAGRQATLAVPGVLRVLPEFASRRHLPSRLARLRELDGRSAVQVRGAGTEFDSLREYVVGDDVRSIDWRATARRNDVVVRTWRPERDRRVLVVLDTGRTSAARLHDAPRLEACIDATLLLAALANRAGDRVDVLAYDRRVRARVRGAQGARLMPALAQALSGVDPELVETDWAGVVAQVRATLSRRSLVVLLSALDSSAVEQGLLGAVGPLCSDHLVVLASASDPALAALRAGRGAGAPLFDAAAAERTALEAQAMAVRLRQRGVEIVEGTPDELAPRLADTYLALKAAGRL